MSYVQQQKPSVDRSAAIADSAALSDTMADTGNFGANDPTVDCYNRRSRILTDADKSEWWVTIAVILLIVGMGFVAI